jgi:hypothetical protein
VLLRDRQHVRRQVQAQHLQRQLRRWRIVRSARQCILLVSGRYICPTLVRFLIMVMPSVARWSRPKHILIVFLTQASPPSVLYKL